MNKGAVIVGVGAGLALLAFAVFSKAETPGGGGGNRQSGGGGGATTDEALCDGYIATLGVLKGQRAAAKGALVDIDAALMAAYQNGDDASAAELEAAKKVQQNAVAAFDAQIADTQARIDEVCGG